MNFIIFGGTGDLAYRKLYPAIQNLILENQIDQQIKIYAIGSRELSQNDYHKNILKGLDEFSRSKVDHDRCKDKLEKDFMYLRGDINKNDIYNNIKNKLGNNEENIFYLAVKPEFFSIISNGLGEVGLNSKNNKLVIEKPFGLDIESANKINEGIRKHFSEENIYRIDHYLGKEMTQNIFILRFANEIFEPILNNKYVDNIQISVCEDIGISSRGRYYDKSGAIRDMLQNHIMQLLTLATMEKPKSLEANDIIDKKVSVLKNLRYADKDIKNCVLFGQYEGYRQEKDVDENSVTETFVAMKAAIDNDRWRGTDIFLKTGKMMEDKYVQIVYELKKPIENLYGRKVESNKLIIRIQPEEGTMINFNLKKPGNEYIIQPVKMDFCQNCEIGINTQEAYEKLISDIIEGDKTSFARWDEVENSWKFVDRLINIDDENKEKMLKIYNKNSKGPKELGEMFRISCEKQ